MRRYSKIDLEQIKRSLKEFHSALSKIETNSGAKQILNGLFTRDEEIKVGRRIQIAELIIRGETYDGIANKLGVGKSTIIGVYKKLMENPECFKLIFKNRLSKTNKKTKYEKRGGSKLVFKKWEKVN